MVKRATSLTPFTERSIDVMALSETWHGGSDDVCLRLRVTDGYAVVDAARTTGRAGRVAVSGPVIVLTVPTGL